jgi:RNA-directed DNA polymerase
LTSLDQLKSATTLKQFAAILGYEAQALSFILYKIPDDQKYTTFEIPKKSGGARQIDAPVARLKYLQRSLSNLLYGCSKEIDAKSNNDKRKSLSHGFKPSHSIITNAYPHRNRRYVLNFDLENFFPSINFGRVRGFFLKNKAFGLHKTVATLIAQIACRGNCLPQGSPCSPIISQLITHVLDVRLVQLAKAHKCRYTRYADDITFSTNQKQFPQALAFPTETATAEWTLGQELIAKVANAGFSINPAKTRMQCKPNRQLVTGLTVNVKVNIRAQYYRYARAMCHSLFKTGSYFQPGMDGPGAIPIPTLAKLEGVLNHIYFVKDEADPRELKKKVDVPTAARTLYKSFLFFKYFVRLEKPLILCEGKTDAIYLKSAIQNLPAFHPRLAAAQGKSVSLNISFFNYTNLAHKVLNIGGGCGGQLALIRDYESFVPKFAYAPLKHPVIVLVDNDSGPGGAGGLFNLVNQKFKLNPSLTSNAPFYALCHNLFLVKTPEKSSGDGSSKIEDLFDPSFLTTAVEGKVFNSSNKKSSENEIGKAALAGIVRANADRIDFSQFAALLNRIVAVIDHYKPNG